MTKEAIVKAPKGRPVRQGINRKQKVKVTNLDPAYHYRLVNDIDDRIEDMMELGYEHVNKTTVGDRDVDKPSSEGTRTQMSVGNGIKGFLMRVRKEDFDEGQKQKDEVVNETERAMKRQALDGNNYGKLEISRS